MLRNRILCAAAALALGLALPLAAMRIRANGALWVREPLYILMYHDVAEGSPEELNVWTTTADKFRADLEWLRGNGYTAYLPSELAAGVPLAERAVMITFDDGYASNDTVVLPLLREYGMKAAVALLCGHVDGGADGYLTWDMCREMASSGLIEFGSHTYDLHAGGIVRLPDESRADYEKRVFPDIERSVERLERETGQKVVYFAYPNGARDTWANDFLREHFAVTVTTGEGVVDASRGLYDLRRFNVSAVRPASSLLPPGA